MALAQTSGSLTDRIVRALRADPNLFEEVEADTNATTQALIVVVLSAVSSGLGLAIAGALRNEAGSNPFGGLIGGVIVELIGWAVWSYVMYFAGTRLFKGTATYGELLRTLGFANAPGLLLILRFIPIVGGLLVFAVGIWRLWTGFVAVRQALDLDTGNTIATIVVGLIGYLLVAMVLGILLAGIGMGGAMMGF